ncbi:MAG TPA: hypothetical protein VGG29_13230 [Caulobacteraceae bacterium]|jgi:hypothetical protein
MKILTQSLIAAVAAAGVGAVAVPASADVVCNGNTCWHTHDHYNYRPEFGVVVHPDHWRWSHHDHYRWREHEGRGYWRNGVWITF